MTMQGYVWMCMAMYNYAWPCMAIQPYVPPRREEDYLISMYGYIWLVAVKRDDWKGPH